MSKNIKVVCLNLWLGGELFDAVLDFLQREDPDILLLQEVFDGHELSLAPQFRSMDVIREHFPYVADDFAATYREAGKGVPEQGLERGNAIFSKFPIVQRHKPVFFGAPYSNAYEDHDPAGWPTAPRNLQHVTLDVHGAELDVFNLQGVWDLDGERDSATRLKMSQMIVDAIQGKQHVIVAGDTNVQPNTQTIRNIEAHLSSIFKDELKTTFNLRRKNLEKFPGYATAVVDMLFASPTLPVIAHACPDVDISDHLPLVAVLEITS